MDLKLKKKRRCIYNFLSATEEPASLAVIFANLKKIESNVRQMIPTAQQNVKVSTILEIIVPVLEAAARIVPDNEKLEEHQQLLSNIGKLYGTQVLCSSVNRMITGTGSTESAYNYAMGLMYFSGTKVKQDCKRKIEISCQVRESEWFVFTSTFLLAQLT